jgi:hypothetical protein
MTLNTEGIKAEIDKTDCMKQNVSRWERKQQKQETNYRMKENSFKVYLCSGLHIQNI